MIDKVVLLDKAVTLGQIYGSKTDTVVYTQGVGLSARLRLEKLGYFTGAKDFALEFYNELINGRINKEDKDWRNDNRSGILWLDDLFEIINEKNIIDPIIFQSDKFIDSQNSILDPNIQVEDQFFVSALLGRAYKHTKDEKYTKFISSHILDSPLQREDGIYIHSNAAPFTWGRGNGFATYGATEAIKYMKDSKYLDEIINKHYSHIDSLIKYQTINGGWRQIIDDENSNEELTSTCMIGYSLASGIKLGYFPEKYMEIVEKAWNFVDNNIENTGVVHESCTGTGSLQKLSDYLIRKRENGFDNRGGSLAAWFLVSIYELEG